MGNFFKSKLGALGGLAGGLGSLFGGGGGGSGGSGSLLTSGTGKVDSAFNYQGGGGPNAPLSPLGGALGDIYNESLRQGGFAMQIAQSFDQLGATNADLAAMQAPLAEQMGRLNNAQGLLNGLTGDLSRSAIGSTSGASIAAVNAARMVGGNTYAGNPAALAARGATDAAVGQSSALANALVQARLGQANYQSGIMQQQGAVAAAQAQALQGIAGMKEQRATNQLNVALSNQQMAAGMYGPAGGTEQARVGAKAQKDTAWLGVLSSFLG